MISIIVPVLNEEDQLPGFLSHTLNLEGDFEVILVDGGSTDRSLEYMNAREDIQLLKAAKGRSLQMNKGAEAAEGDILLFLHVDTRLPSGAIQEILDIMEDAVVMAGSFRLQFDFRHIFLDLLAYVSRWNHAISTYGDQGLFVRQSVFNEVGKFRKIPIMEDVEIQTRLRKKGKFIKSPMRVTTSARRFLKNGIYRQFMMDVLLVGFFKMGISTHRLKKFYPDT